MELAEPGLTEDLGLLAPVETSLTKLAIPIATHAQDLLRVSPAIFLSLTMVRGQISPVTMCWIGPPEPVAAQSVLDVAQPDIVASLAGFQNAGRRLIAELARRWPRYAVPPAIGVVTDGSGVVFSSEHPSPLIPGWLALHQLGFCVPTVILEFSSHGAWEKLTAPIPRHRIH